MRQATEASVQYGFAPQNKEVTSLRAKRGHGREAHGLKFSVATTDFRHSNFTQATYENNVEVLADFY